MAAEKLQAILTELPIEHEPRHDIESFIDVLAYSVTSRRAVLQSQPLDEAMRKKLHLFFYSTFGRMIFGPLDEDRDRSQFASVSQDFSPRQCRSSWVIWTLG
jgi:VanZ family protein